MIAADAPTPTLDPFETLTPPARAASFVLSLVEITTFSPVIVARLSVPVPTAMITFVFALLASTAIAPPTDALLPLPLTAPASACAASWPRKSPFMFCVSVAESSTSPFDSTLPPLISTIASLLLTLTATPAAMELALFASEMEAPVPSVRKLPSLTAVACAPPSALSSPETSVLALWLETVRPTAAATCSLLPWLG